MQSGVCMARSRESDAAEIRLLTSKEVADMVGIHVVTFRTLCREGHGPVATILSKRRGYAREDVVVWMRLRKRA